MKPCYDYDGNLTTNGVWSYSWDAENRLTAVYSNNTLLVSNTYDHRSRRIAKIVSHGGTETQRRTFLYDDWNLIQELITDNGSLTTNSFTWGLDLSGSLQGAGGVGGLLAVNRDASVYFPCFDANGTVTEYIDATGTIRAHYAFDAFGNTISQSGDLASTFSHRFSTKYFDGETGLYYYGYRYYSPELGRWVSRDPIEEEGGLNLFIFCGNRSLSLYDAEGLDYLDCLGDCIEKNDPINAIIDIIIERLGAKADPKYGIGAKLGIGSAGVPKSILLWIARMKNDVELVEKIERSILLGKDLGYKPLKVILSWLKVNRGKAALAARSQGYILAVYGPVLAIIELNCAGHCICKDKYEGNNIFNTKEAINFYIDKLF
jgi:RHS repeat-associated protein